MDSLQGAGWVVTILLSMRHQFFYILQRCAGLDNRVIPYLAAVSISSRRL